MLYEETCLSLGLPLEEFAIIKRGRGEAEVTFTAKDAGRFQADINFLHHAAALYQSPKAKLRDALIKLSAAADAEAEAKGGRGYATLSREQLEGLIAHTGRSADRIIDASNEMHLALQPRSESGFLGLGAKKVSKVSSETADIYIEHIANAGHLVKVATRIINFLGHRVGIAAADHQPRMLFFKEP